MKTINKGAAVSACTETTTRKASFLYAEPVYPFTQRKSSQKRAKWFYTLREKDHQVTDYFILFALVDNEVGAVYVLPRAFVPAVCITITKLDGNVRYDYFKTDLDKLAEKIENVQANLPNLIRIYRKAKGLKSGE